VNQTKNVDEGSKTEFRGWARMGLELGSAKRDKHGMRLVRVDPPHLGERVPSQVIAEVVLDLHSCTTSLAREWDEIGEFDNLFLVYVDASKATGDPAPSMGEIGRNGEEIRVPDKEDCTFPLRYGIMAVRGCMVLEVRDVA
jgi:intron-binding protein aquarius